MLAPAREFVSAPQFAALDLLRSNAKEIAAAIPDAARAYTRDWPHDVEARAEARRKAERAMEVARAEAFGRRPPKEKLQKGIFEDFTIDRVDVDAAAADGRVTVRLLGSCAWDAEHGLLVEVVAGQLARLDGQY